MRNILGLLTALALASAAAAAPMQPWTGDSIIRDPEWQKRFLGSYGFLSGAEPEIKPTELELLREVIDLLSANPRAAQARLQGSVGAGSSAAVDFILANLEFQNGELEQANAHYRSALEKFPDFRRAHKNLGLLLVQKDDCKSALVHLARAVELGDRDGRNFGLLGYCHLEGENHVAAESAYRDAVLQEPDAMDWQLGLARALLAMEQFKEAAALFASVIEKDPENANAWMLQANAFLGLDRPDAAAVNLEAVRMLGRAQPASLVLLGDIYMNRGIPELAKSAYLEVIAGDAKGEHFATACRAAELLIRTRAHGEAEDVLASIGKRYPKLTPDDELKVLTLRAKLARAQGRSQEAVKLLESIVERDGTRGDALLELAAYYHEQGDLARALLQIERAQRLDAFEYQALLDHAQMMVAAKDYAKAAELLREAIEIKREPRVERFLARVEQAIRR